MTKTGQVKTKTTFSRPRPFSLKTIKLLTQDFKSTFPFRKKSGQLCGFAQSCRYYAGNRKKPGLLPAFWSSFALSKIRILRFFSLKKGFKTFLVLRFFKTSRLKGH